MSHLSNKSLLLMMLFFSSNSNAIDFDRIAKEQNQIETKKPAVSTDNHAVEKSNQVQSQFVQEDYEARRRQSARESSRESCQVCSYDGASRYNESNKQTEMTVCNEQGYALSLTSVYQYHNGVYKPFYVSGSMESFKTLDEALEYACKTR